jgi:hypothetical protein
MTAQATASTLQLCRVTAHSGVSCSSGVAYEEWSNCIHEIFPQNTDVIVGVLESQSGTEHMHLNICQWRLVLLIVVMHVFTNHTVFNPIIA